MNEKLLKSVAEIQKEFIYEKFVAGDYTIYHCHKPGTSTYSFEIILGKMGIYVGGDIDSLSYRVARGIEFLAGDDIDYYQHSKLEHVYYDKKVIDKNLVEDYLIDILWGALDGLPYEDIPNDRPETIEKIVAFYQESDQWTVYMVRCAKGALYTGIALDVSKRLAQHNSGTGSKAVRDLGTPVKLVFSEVCDSKSEALKREYAIKQMTRSEKLMLISSIQNSIF